MKIEMVVHSPSSSPSWSSAQLSIRSSSGQEGGGQCRACPLGSFPGGQSQPSAMSGASLSTPQLPSLGLARGTPSFSAVPCAGALLGEGTLTDTHSPGGQVQRVGGSAESGEGLVSVGECPRIRVCGSVRTSWVWGFRGYWEGSQVPWGRGGLVSVVSVWISC